MIFKELYDEFKIRIKGPFYKTFLLSWLIINWRIIFTALGNVSTQSKIDKIDNYLSCTSHSLYFPLIAAFLFFLGYRWVEVAAEYYLNWINRVKKKNKIKSDKSSLFTTAEYLEKIDNLESLNEIALRTRTSANEYKLKFLKSEETCESQSLIINEKELLLKNSSYSTSAVLEGDWILKFKNHDHTIFTEENICIESRSSRKLQFKKLKGKKAGEGISVNIGEGTCIFESFLFQQTELRIYVAGENKVYDGQNSSIEPLFFLELMIKNVKPESGKILLLEGFGRGEFIHKKGRFDIILERIK